MAIFAAAKSFLYLYIPIDFDHTIYGSTSMMNVKGSAGGVPNGKSYQLSTIQNKGHMIVKIELENSEEKPIELLFEFQQAMEFRDEVEKVVWMVSP